MNAPEAVPLTGTDAAASKSRVTSLVVFTLTSNRIGTSTLFESILSAVVVPCVLISR
jgi:hypothetical protein